MKLLHLLMKIFLLPGTLVLSSFDIEVESDGGIFRSLINMIFWGFIGIMILLPFMTG